MIPVQDMGGGKKVVPFAAWHLLALDLRPLDRKALGPFQLTELAAKYVHDGFSFTGMVDGRPVCCWGVLPFWPGVASLWLATSEGILPVRKTFHATAREHLAGVVENLGLWRIEATVLPEHVVSRRWVERLGFEEEGPRRHFGPGGETFLLYSRIHPENLPKEAQGHGEERE